MNLLFCSHCDFHGNSALHIQRLGEALNDRGNECVMVIPGDAATVPRTSLRVLSIEAAVSDQLRFADGRPVDLMHAWTPRAHVIGMVEQLRSLHRCPVVVHMEDNEEVILEREIRGLYTLDELRSAPYDFVDRAISNPFRTNISQENRFLAQADGYSCVTERLLEFAPEGVPVTVMTPGFDPIFAAPRDRATDRAELDIEDGRCVAGYFGNIHASNLEDMRSLYAGLALTGRRLKRKLLLIRTGWDQVPFEFPNSEALEVRRMGFVSRDRLPALAASADILVQPGRVDDFNAYRFPSKTPDLLVSGRPVVLPNANLGLKLVSGREAMKLITGDAFDIADAVGHLLLNPVIAEQIGQAGRRFALDHLAWTRAAEVMERLYRQVMIAPPRSASPTPKGRFPGKVIAIATLAIFDDPGGPDLLYEAGVEALALDLDATPWPGRTLATIQLCAICRSAPDVGAEQTQRLVAAIKRPDYFRLDGIPVVLLRPTCSLTGPAEAEHLREALAACSLPIHAICTTANELEGAHGDGGLNNYVRHVNQGIDAVVRRPNDLHRVLAPVDLDFASVSAYAQWLRIAVAGATRAESGWRLVSIDGLNGVAEAAGNGDARSHAILNATREALIQGGIDAMRPPFAQDDARFLERTTFRPTRRSAKRPS